MRRQDIPTQTLERLADEGLRMNSVAQSSAGRGLPMSCAQRPIALVVIAITLGANNEDGRGRPSRMVLPADRQYGARGRLLTLLALNPHTDPTVKLLTLPVCCTEGN
jgi:hypothetical protein